VRDLAREVDLEGLEVELGVVGRVWVGGSGHRREDGDDEVNTVE
jgi:hypothetical protein